MMKKWVSLCLCVWLLLSLTACGKKAEKPAKTTPTTTTTPSTPEDENYAAAMARLGEGNWQAAYDLFKASADPRAAAQLEKFVFVPTTYTFENSQGANYTDTYTYDERGNLIEDKSVGKTGWHYDRDVLTTYTYDEANRQLSGTTRYEDSTSSYTYTYDKDGHVLSYCGYDDGELVARTDYTYDERGNQLTLRQWYNEVREYNNRYEVSTYDEKDRLLTHTVTYEGEEPIVRTYTYAEDGSYYYERACYYESEDVVEQGTLTYYYDSEGRNLGYKVVTEDGTVHEQEEIRLNENGDEIYRRTLYDDVDSVTTRTYNERGQILLRQTTEDGEVTSSSKYTYDERGNTLSAETFSGIYSWSNRVCTYDEQDRLLTERETGPWGWEDRTYTYDEAGNCIKEEKNGYDGTGTKEYTYDEWGNRLTYYRYDENDDGGLFVCRKSVQWALHYYPDEMPGEVKMIIEEIDAIQA